MYLSFNSLIKFTSFHFIWYKSTFNYSNSVPHENLYLCFAVDIEHKVVIFPDQLQSTRIAWPRNVVRNSPKSQLEQIFFFFFFFCRPFFRPLIINSSVLSLFFRSGQIFASFHLSFYHPPRSSCHIYWWQIAWHNFIPIKLLSHI